MWGCLVATVLIMEDMEVVDYSSDRLESTDIWEVPGGGFLEHLVEIPRLGMEEQVPVNKPLGLEDFSSPSAFLVSSPVAHVPAVNPIFSVLMVCWGPQAGRMRGCLCLRI